MKFDAMVKIWLGVKGTSKAPLQGFKCWTVDWIQVDWRASVERMEEAAGRSSCSSKNK